MDPSTEIRKLTPEDVYGLSMILDQNDQWKYLMRSIPKVLERDHRCNVSPENPHKYNSDHVRILEDASKKSRRECTEILFSEWGTSGKIRPTVGHLLYLLVKAKLFRAADYVAVNLLHQEKPKRPSSGPEACISDFADDVIYSNPVGEASNIEQHIPDIVITNVDQEVILMPIVSDRAETSVNDKIEFSDSLIPVVVENMAPPVETDDSSFNFATNTPTSTDNSTANFPDIPGLNLNLENGTEPKPETPPSSEENMSSSAISLLQNEYGLDQSFLPDFAGLGMNSKMSSMTLNISSKGSSDTSLHSPTCSSPLPTLSLDTRLPHFSYSSLLTATNDFNVIPYSEQNEKGRLLGSGEFGSVFLALGLLEKPVAVKKLFLGNAEVVGIDDEVTKQFRNEVEVLTKYKHENLLNLLGFSCDGCTYCLLYEYIPGGTLKHRLQDTENVLQWKSRLNIAIGTSKAVSYLHTAFDTPLIHRDINSSNILLDSENNPKLSDFGLIKLIPNQNTAVATMVYGTSAYMAREAFGGDISVKLDTFSFGVVLLELITSLSPLDENRKGNDLVTHIEETVEDDNILPLVDYRAGSWEDSNLNYATKLFKIAQGCLKEKRKRPTMVEVSTSLDELTKNIQLH